jgi:hypothetical protein
MVVGLKVGYGDEWMEQNILQSRESFEGDLKRQIIFF